ncbi:MAG: stage V sporulation protein AD, partial [Clostridia bacterium]|nr:stage V sporulation protein AD [Clostridia bacterium]
YSACATMAESLALGACLVDRQAFSTACCATASHFSSAERQYRFPLELGNQRPPTSQWTVTGGGATIVSSKGKGPVITSATFGKVIDFGIKDVNNMGACMAPAAMDTIMTHLKATDTRVEDYDLIATGDLGKLGSEILVDLLERKGIKLGQNYSDCGNLIYNKQEKVFMGGSGSGCSATVLNSYIMHKLRKGDFKKVLLVATGALLSTTTSQQGDSIPGIAHAVCIEGDK